MSDLVAAHSVIDSVDVPLAQANHAVQFYETDEFLIETVGSFVSEGLARGDSVSLILMAGHRAQLAEFLSRKAIDLETCCAVHDAEALLSSFMEGPAPNPQKFRHVAEAIVGEPGSRVYGEMVDILWRNGNPEAAIRLEHLWNALIAERNFSLLCSYGIAHFSAQAEGPALAGVCSTHGRVIPAESFGALRRRVDHEHEFLLDVSAALNRSLDYNTRVREIVRLAVPFLGDACAIDIRRADGECDRVNTEPGVPFRLQPIDRVIEVLRTGEPRIIDFWWMIVPMKLADHTIGALSLTITESRRRYSIHDLRLAMDFARHAAVALENARLYELTQTANRIKDEFLATLSHELRTPLTAILGWACMLKLNAVDSETAQIALDTIERSARAQAALVDDLLDLSKVATGKLVLTHELVDVGLIVDDAVRTLRLAADARQIPLDVSRASALVNGDSVRLQQIVSNLVSNAVKFSLPGRRIRIAVETGRKEVQIIVGDEGCGIAAEFLPHVFEPFRQADGATTRAYGGLGLGLAIVKHLTELHGGTVTADSPGEGCGATFTVTLPLAAPDRREF